jgi:metal-dependent hydrolase (beta-lactamase superfamily II)
MDSNEKYNIVLWPYMGFGILSGLVFILLSLLIPEFSNIPSSHSSIISEMLKEIGIGLLVAGSVGLVFESLANKQLIGTALSRISSNLSNAQTKQESLLDALELRVNKVGDEIVMTSGMLKNATKVGIESVYDGREDSWHQDLAKTINESKGTIRIIGISLADVCGYYGGVSPLHEAMERRMDSNDRYDNIQILFADPEGYGLKIRAKYEHPGIEYEETRAYKQTVAKIKETLEIAKDAIASGKAEINLYSDTPMCFLVLTEERLFVEQYHYAGRGGQSYMMAIKGKTPLFRLYETHFEALWRQSKPAGELLLKDGIVGEGN